MLIFGVGTSLFQDMVLINLFHYDFAAHWGVEHAIVGVGVSLFECDNFALALLELAAFKASVCGWGCVRGAVLINEFDFVACFDGEGFGAEFHAFNFDRMFGGDCRGAQGKKETKNSN